VAYLCRHEAARAAGKLRAKGKRGERWMRHLNREWRRFLAVLALPGGLVSDLLRGYSYLGKLAARNSKRWSAVVYPIGDC
jgi:hypothetical protein